ncbi:MAG: PorP/SprF family type IX secretion system membrane protein, partial [Pricia sp.]
MNRPLLFLCLSLFALASWAQQERLPADLRQHNLTTYNASLFNPAFSLDRNNPESVALWVRWQWQGIDSDPSTLFLNYTRKLNERSAAGAAFFQHNTGIFFNTGGAVNYAYKFDLNPRVNLSVGANLFGFQQKLADDRFQTNPGLPLPINNETNDFILQFAPGISLEVERLTLSLASENLLDYNFGAKEGNTAKEDKIFMSLLSYDFPVDLGSARNAFLRPSMYLRTIPGQSNQVGFYTLLNTDKYWGQVGYNNFYGFALGAGYTFFDRVMVGALAEFGTGASIVKQSSFELMASYFLGTPEERHTMVGHDLDEDVLNPLESIEEEQDREKSEEESMDEDVEEDEILSEEKLREQEIKEAEKQQKEAEKVKKQEAKQQA